VSRHLRQGDWVAISTKEILYFEKSGLEFLDILFSDFLLRKDSRTCGSDRSYNPYD
jgi:hypothetical protein